MLRYEIITVRYVESGRGHVPARPMDCALVILVLNNILAGANAV